MNNNLFFTSLTGGRISLGCQSSYNYIYWTYSHVKIDVATEVCNYKV
jgi:hypothetical protein